MAKGRQEVKPRQIGIEERLLFHQFGKIMA